MGTSLPQPRRAVQVDGEKAVLSTHAIAVAPRKPHDPIIGDPLLQNALPSSMAPT